MNNIYIYKYNNVLTKYKIYVNIKINVLINKIIK